MHVSEYDDYRKFIRDKIDALTSPRSLKTLSQKWGCSRMFVKYVLDGKRHLSIDKATSVAEHLDLKNIEREYFLTLLRFNKEKCHAKRSKHLRKLLELKSAKMSSCKNTTLTAAEIFSHWLTPVIVELQSFVDFSPTCEWIRKQLLLPVSDSEIAAGLSSASAYLTANKDADVEKRVLPDGFRSVIYKSYVAKNIEKSIEALHKIDPSDREYFSLTISVPEERFREAVTEIRAFRARLHDILANNGACTRVVQVNFQMYSLAKSED